MAVVDDRNTSFESSCDETRRSLFGRSGPVTRAASVATAGRTATALPPGSSAQSGLLGHAPLHCLDFTP